MKKILLFIQIVLLVNLAHPINHAVWSNCKVLLEEISESYTGDCRAGLAHGQGVAIGVDRYVGSFRNGLPHGRGTYTWANGDVFEGRWRNGLRHGRGTMTVEIDGRRVSERGSWKDGEFMGKREDAAYTRGHILNLERFTVNRKGEGNRVMVNFYYMGRMGQFPNDFLFRMESGFSHREGLNVGYEEVSFPARILITYSVPDKLGRGLSIPVRFEITINQPGDWEIKLYN